MRKLYQTPSAQHAECITDLMTTIVVTSPSPTDRRQVDPIHPRDPGESLAPDRDEWEFFPEDNQQFEYGSLW